MNTNRDQLDDAIDHVAKRLTHVDDDAQFSARVIAALPERVTWFGWLTHSWAPRLAMMAIIAGTFVFWSARHSNEVAPAAQPLASVANPNWPQLTRSVEPERLELVSRMPLEPVEPLEPMEPYQGLPSIDAPKAIAVNEVGPVALPDGGSLSLPSLTLTELPLTAEFPERH